MPIEIKELVIKATVDNQTAANRQSTRRGSGSSNTNIDQQAIIDACIEQVLQILRDKAER